MAVVVHDPDAEDAGIRGNARAANAVIHGCRNDACHVGAVVVVRTGGKLLKVIVSVVVLHRDYGHLSGKVLVIRVHAGVQHRNGNAAAGGYAPGGIAVHHIMLILVGII